MQLPQGLQTEGTIELDVPPEERGIQWMLSTVFDSISPVFLLTLYLYTMIVSSSVVANLKLLMAHPLPTGNHCNTRDMAASELRGYRTDGANYLCLAPDTLAV